VNWKSGNLEGKYGIPAELLKALAAKEKRSCMIIALKYVYVSDE